MSRIFESEPYRSDMALLREKYGAREWNAMSRMLADYLSRNEKSKGGVGWSQIVSRLMDDEPLQYILGETWFYGMRLSVNDSVLIPRPETEELVNWAIQWVKFQGLENGHAVDWGTGSGCIALALKKACPSWRVTARDVSTEALDTAKRNAFQNSMLLDFELRSLTDDLPEGQSQVELILSNPPYIPFGERAVMPPNVLRFEPPLALFTPGKDPLIFYRYLEKRAAEELLPDGVMIMEINEFRASATELIFRENKWHTKLAKDLSRKCRMLMVARTPDRLVNYRPF